MHLAPLDSQNLWVVVSLQSGTSFSRGLLFFSQDGGATWTRLVAPLGEPVKFSSSDRGWMAGGPAGDLLYRTDDGGGTWVEQPLPIPEGNPAGVGLPAFDQTGTGWLPILLRDDSGERLAYLTSDDGGLTWESGQGLPPESGVLAAEVGTLLLKSDAVDPSQAGVKSPEGAVALASFGGQSYWAIVQEGTCTGEKVIPAGSAAGDVPPFECTQSWSLLASDDGGLTWREAGGF
jgi:hypothetical protein